MERFFFITCFMILVGCKEDKSENINKKTEYENRVNPYLTVTLKAKVEESDKFQLYFSEEILGQYHPEDIVEVNLKGSDDFQLINFELPERIYPIKLRVDLGVNKRESPIVIEEITLSTGSKSKVYRNSELLKYFKPNKYIELDEATQSYNRKVVDGIYDPFLISININKVVTSLFKKKSIE